MSFLRKGKSRRGMASRAMVTTFALVAFQALAIVGAGMASAVTGCTYNPATQTITITIDPGQEAAVAVEDADDLDAESPSGAILFTGTPTFDDFENGVNSTQCGSATNANTTSIIVLGSPGNDEFFYIDNGGWNGGGPFSSTIAWAIDMGSNTAAGADEVDIYLTNDGSNDDALTLTDTGFTMNGATGTLLGVELSLVRGFDGDDVLDGSAAVNLVTQLHGGPGFDWVALGAVAGPTAAGLSDEGRGGSEVDTLSYGHRTTCTVIDEPGGEAGRDGNCDGDLADTGDEVDDHTDFEVFETGTANDTLIGDGDDETFIPGDGDDDITGNGGDDLLDYTSSSAAMTIDPANETATGQGTDTYTGVLNFLGSPQNDTLIWDDSVDGFAGGAGTDVVDASAETTGQFIDLDDLDDLSGTNAEDVDTDTTENAIGGSGPDELDGNDLRNRLEGGAGDDDLDGDEGNDTFLGGAGNDDFTGDEGADRVSFIGSPNGVNVDLSLGFATGEGDDSFGDLIEIIVGSPHNDQLTGGPFAGGGTVNFLLIGKGGNDLLTGFNGNDTLRGNAGNDIMRGVSGDDTLRAGAGNDRLFGGSGVDVGRGGPGQDRCKGTEIQTSCGTFRNPRAPQAARLV
jgi:hypothetical protein